MGLQGPYIEQKKPTQTHTKNHAQASGSAQVSHSSTLECIKGFKAQKEEEEEESTQSETQSSDSQEDLDLDLDSDRN